MMTKCWVPEINLEKLFSGGEAVFGIVLTDNFT